MSTRVYEFVVSGRIGPDLRTMLADLEIDDLPPRTRLLLQNCDPETLLLAVGRIAAGAGEIDTIYSS